jgi:hypothetical protein
MAVKALKKRMYVIGMRSCEESPNKEMSLYYNRLLFLDKLKVFTKSQSSNAEILEMDFSCI